MAEPTIDLRPRSTGEVLDDAWRLALADAPALLALSAVFVVPAFAALLLLLGRPQTAGVGQIVWPAMTALLIALTGLGSGACQEWFRRSLEGRPPRPLSCVGAALRHGLEHAAARAVVLSSVLAGLVLLVMPGLSLWAAAAPVHALIASGRGRRGGLLGELAREAAFDPAKAATVTLLRLPLLLVAAVNVHILLLAALWAAEAFAGLETALLSVQLGLFTNPIYTVGLLLLCWLLLTPFFEASNFLLHLDTRTRREGIDLFYRIQRVFPAADAAPAAVGPSARQVGAMLLALAGTLLAAPAASAAESERDAVRAARTVVQAIRMEVKAAQPYTGGGPWEGRLRAVAGRLERGGGADRYAWFRQALGGFGRRSRDEALDLLGSLHNRLALVEDSLSERAGPDPQKVKSLVRHEGEPRGSGPARAEKKKAEPPKREKPEVEEDELPQRRRTRVSSGTGLGPSPSGGFGLVGWAVLAGLAVAIVAAAGYLFWSSRPSEKPQRTPVVSASARAPLEDLPQPGTTSAAELWRQAEALAGEGRFPEAVRLLYLAVLFELDRRQLLRYERTRTNGEYVRQVRLSERAPPGLHEPFERLTGHFEQAWYGSQPVAAEDYRPFQSLAVQVRDGAAAT
jgi:hypothetical protein